MGAMKAAIPLLLLLLIGTLDAQNPPPPFASRRARCAVECYTKCVMAGTPKAVYCNCPLSIELQPCNAVTEELMKRSMVGAVPHVETSYKDVRTILIKMEPYNGAFIYVFEYSTISGDVENWVFAGASSSPQITFNVPDACRDYQFRAIVVLRSTDPALQLVVFRPRAIPVALPRFVVPPESIRLDTPRQSSDDQSLHVFVSWHNPRGYDDADVYGYEQPIAFPIRCQTPEDKLAQPRVELVEGGARMHLNLPIEVLQEKCRILVEVRMLPRCVRVDSYDIQASVELDCVKFPDLKFCQKEMGPQCAEVVDVWGREGKAMVVWQPPKQLQPLHYILKYGLADQVGARPFLSRKIINGEEFKIPGNVTNSELIARPGIEYGLQICGIYSLNRAKLPFEVVPVVPFICAECPGDALHCIDCAKIEDGPSHPFIPVVECKGNNCTNVARGNAVVKSALGIVQSDGTPPATDELIPQQKHSKTLSTNAVIPLNASERTTPENDFAEVGELAGEEKTPVPTEGQEDLEDITVAKVFRSESTTEPPSSTSSSSSTTTTTLAPTTTPAASSPSEGALAGKVDLVAFTTPPTQSGESGEARARGEDVRLHQPKSSTPCKQRSGVVCEFGCVDDLRCECPKHDVPCIRGVFCPSVGDLRAVYENKTRTLRLYSATIASLLRNDSAYDKLYLEFGELSARGAAGGASRPAYSFAKRPAKEHAMLSINKMDKKADTFGARPYEFSMENALDVTQRSYGLSVCALNSSLVPIILDNVLMEQSAFHENSIGALTQTLLSPVELSEESAQPAARSDSHKSFLIFLGPAFLVLGVLLFGITVLCMNLFRRRESTAAKLRRRGLLRDHRMQFTAYRPSLGLSPSSFYSDNSSRYHRNVYF
ncbi:hypothetical protein M3Y99_01110200 [Aphelenchoides fujianensis]|nr:hypothetical protein M3Y99_01110200 [Aphelenchoides fujianensis]